MPAHLRRLTENSYLATALAVFVVAVVVQLALYRWLLHAHLVSGDLQQVRPAFRRWLGAAVAWQAVAIAGAGVYVLVMARQHAAGIAWIAPALGVLLGTALPLQLVASTALRAGFRAPR